MVFNGVFNVSILQKAKDSDSKNTWQLEQKKIFIRPNSFFSIIRSAFRNPARAMIAERIKAGRGVTRSHVTNFL